MICNQVWLLANIYGYLASNLLTGPIPMDQEQRHNLLIFDCNNMVLLHRSIFMHINCGGKATTLETYNMKTMKTSWSAKFFHEGRIGVLVALEVFGILHTSKMAHSNNASILTMNESNYTQCTPISSFIHILCPLLSKWNL
ncbi:hypothetical protein CFP56_034221 [Quercus suber]|uniref:Uncharacterized protein n=1 Tax=Quercus suber TaxID=58331 RepID=A0AAW0JET1_QUESU